MIEKHLKVLETIKNGINKHYDILNKLKPSSIFQTLQEINDSIVWLQNHEWIAFNRGIYSLTKIGEEEFTKVTGLANEIQSNHIKNLSDKPFIRIQNVHTEPITEKKNLKSSIIISVIKTISNNPLISGIVALIIGTLLLKWLHVI